MTGWLTDALDWRRLLDSCERLASTGLLTACLRMAKGDQHHELALLVPELGDFTLRTAVQQSAAGLDETTLLAEWLLSTADDVRHYFGTIDIDDVDVAEHTARTFPVDDPVAMTAALVLDPALGPLPLLELAEDAARLRTADGRLRVHALHPGGTARGMYLYESGDVLIDPGLDDDQRADVFAHELAHVLDGERMLIRTTAARETFARTLGPLLLEHQPATVADATPLMLRAEYQCPMRLDLAGLPAPGPQSVTVWMFAPLRGRVDRVPGLRTRTPA